MPPRQAPSGAPVIVTPMVGRILMAVRAVNADGCADGRNWKG